MAIFGVAGVGSQYGVVWNSSGEAWAATPSGYQRFAAFDLPVPTEQVKLLTGAEGSALLVTTADEVWVKGIADFHRTGRMN